MRVATFNVLHGAGLVDGRVDPGRFADAVRRLDADVLGLQEVDRDQPRSGRVDLAAVAAEAMGAVAHRFLAAVDGTPGGQWRAARSAVPAGCPAYGIALLSRLPVRSWHEVRLPALPLRAPVVVPERRLPVLTRDEPRRGLAAVLATGTEPLTVATTHLSFVPGCNLVQLRRLRGALRRLPGPRLLVGDLNLPGRLPALVTGWESLLQEPTWPAHEPRWQLDHVLADGLRPSSPARAVQLAVSDHRAVVVDL